MKIHEIIMNLRSGDEDKILQTAKMAADELELLEERLAIIFENFRKSSEISSAQESWMDETKMETDKPELLKERIPIMAENYRKVSEIISAQESWMDEIM